ncbi:N-acetylated-alpha-linked acidic dipeptidase-like protein [Orbicella faveolata]|uniref:N-acetylated-alpha-linked acidic dipeptidase-like protein n=1 Tax=Orbicella faveolata TaxID=48498 RepID=UPI0009E35E27|nr:N-acetylated-alpha-linked acidic dipeptidase-like protein [Orbicella faveolata]
MEFEMSPISRPRRRREILLVVLLAVCFAVCGFLIGYFAMKAGKDATKCQKDNGGTNPERHSSKEKYHTMFQNEINAENIEDNLRFITSEPHMAGSTRQRDLAAYLAKKWRKYGFDVVEMPEYRVPLSLYQKDKPNKVEIIVNGTIQSTILGRVEVRAEPTASKVFNYTPYFAYSPNGTVEGELVYINRGCKSDMDRLNSTGVSLKNKIVIARSIFSRVGTIVLG